MWMVASRAALPWIGWEARVLSILNGTAKVNVNFVIDWG
jgi:hypothetical protein